MNVTSTLRLPGLRADGSLIPVEIHVDSHDSGVMRSRLPGEDWHRALGGDLFICLLETRRHLESKGLLLCCQGARPDVSPSGMQRQMGDGRIAYVLDRSYQPPMEVDILDPADPAEIGTLEQQRRNVLRFYGLQLPDEDEREDGETP